MRVKKLPRQHKVYGNVEKSDTNDRTEDRETRISRSEPCLKFINEDFETTMQKIVANQQVHQPNLASPGLEEALDLAMPTRMRCQYERHLPCFGIIEDATDHDSGHQLDEAIDLSMKKNRQEFPSKRSENSRPCNELKATFLYKMLTDPLFFENLRGGKQRSSVSPPSCTFCKKSFSTEEELVDHLNVRKNEYNQVACCACDKTFAQKRYLRYHQRCHAERAKFTCEICTKNYSRLDNLTRHTTFHTNPDKFPCTSCERTFARKDLLKKHIKCHENRHRYHCAICDKYFKGPLSLENHKKIFHTSA